MIKMFLRSVILIALSASVSSCGNQAEPYPDAEITETEAGNTLIVTEDFSALILTREFMEARSRTASPPEYWTPKIDQIFEIESNLAEYLAQHGESFNSGRAPDEEELSTYGRQYFGMTNEEGTSIIGHFFCSQYIKDFDWKNRIPSVKGGGDCFFGVWWNPDTQTFIAVHANSPE